MHKCYYCGHMTVYWQADFLSEEYGYPEGGLVRTFCCSHCGADIEVYIPAEDEDEQI